MSNENQQNMPNPKGGVHKPPVAVVSFVFHNDGRVEANCAPNEPEGEITMGDVLAVTSAHLLLGFGEDLIKGGTLGKISSTFVHSGASMDSILADEE